MCISLPVGLSKSFSVHAANKISTYSDFQQNPGDWSEHFAEDPGPEETGRAGEVGQAAGPQTAGV